MHFPDNPIEKFMSKSSSRISQTPIDPDFDQRFATSFVNFCIAQSGGDANKLKKLILTAPLRDSASGLSSVVWNSMQSGFSEAERPRADDDKSILNLYLRNLDAIKENLTAKIAPLANINNAQRASIAEAFDILENVKSHDPQISLGKIVYDAKEGRTASMIKVNLDKKGTDYYGEVKYKLIEQKISPVEIIEGKGVLMMTICTYEGDFVNGDMSGKGVLTFFPQGYRYEGDFIKGNLHGRGVATFTNGRSYNGDWRDGRYHGQGILTYQDGSKYIGGFANDKRSGQGILTQEGSMIMQGRWSNDDLVEDLMSNEGDSDLHGTDAEEENPSTVPHSITVRKVSKATRRGCNIS